jgi:hypothetical protein
MSLSLLRRRVAVVRSVVAGLLILMTAAIPFGFGQTELATVFGRVTDQSGAVISGAEVDVRNVGTNASTLATTNSDGLYSVASLHPGEYVISVRKAGFRTVSATGLELNVQDNVARNFALQVGSASESVTVTAETGKVNTTDATVSTVVDRNFAENLPMNGRSFQTLIQLTPGVVLTAYNLDDNGQFSVNGQRAESNYWMVDGVSANVGIGTSQYSAGNGVGGASAAYSALGGTNSMVSVDALQEFRIQTSTFAPEFGRTPGGQISIVTRSGANQWHGSAFDYFRNGALDANDWFADATGQPKPEERQNDFGGIFSGPIVKNRTFFFFSYEGLRLRLPRVAEELVPDLSARQNAAPSMQPYLNAFPLPSVNAPDDLTTQISQFNASFANPASLDAYSLRIDHKLRENLAVFGRYNYSPSTSSQRGSGTLNGIARSKVLLQTATVGATWTLSSTAVNDLRFNYSRTKSTSHGDMDGFGGGVPLTSLPFPNGFNANNSVLALFWFPLAPYFGPDLGFQGNNLQRQVNIVDNVGVQKGNHSLKFGIDYRRLAPLHGAQSYLQDGGFTDVPSSLSGTIAFGAVSAGRNGALLFHNVGAFAQDTWRASRVLTLTYGLRWDVDFAPSADPALLAVTGFNANNFSNLAPAPHGTAPFRTTYGNLAPRIGVAYQLHGSQDWQTVLRGGFGIFYDLASSQAGNMINPNYYPFGATNLFFTGPFPYNPTLATPPPITAATLPQSHAYAFDPNLKLPYVLQWNFAFDQALGSSQTITASYIGASGRRLLQQAFINAPNPNFGAAILMTNAAVSSYNALQIQFQRRLTHGLQTLAAYTWAHSIDTASAGSLGNNGNGLIPDAVNLNRGPSDFDIRNAASVGVTYDVPALHVNGFAKMALRGWSIQNIFQAHSALPVNVYDGSFSFLLNAITLVRPDVVPGQPFYLYGPQYPGGKALNRAAFVDPPVDSNGNPLRSGDFSRNALRGFATWQWDFAVHRDFPLHEALALEFRAEMFNVLNHPSFAPPVSDLSNSTQFGLSTQSLGGFLAGSGGTAVGNTGGFSPLYQIGGPRSIQFGLKLKF